VRRRSFEARSGASPGVETSLDAAGKSACATKSFRGEDFPGLFKERIGIADSLGVWASLSPFGIFRRSLSLEIKCQFFNGLGEV